MASISTILYFKSENVANILLKKKITKIYGSTAICIYQNSAYCTSMGKDTDTHTPVSAESYITAFFFAFVFYKVLQILGVFRCVEFLVDLFRRLFFNLENNAQHIVPIELELVDGGNDIVGPTAIEHIKNPGDLQRFNSDMVADLEELRVLGFDCEWVTEKVKGKPIRRPVSIMQLSTSSGKCYIFYMSKLSMSYFPRFLTYILGDCTILKLGINCCYDADLLQCDYGITVRGCLDLRHLYEQQISLAALAKNVLNVSLTKERYIVCTNWKKDVLSDKEIEYAAKDAWVAIEIFKKWRLNKPGENIEKYLDKPFKNMKLVIKESAVPKSNTKNIIFKDKNQKFARKSQLYDNCWMYAKDGQLLCSCDERKAQWYVSNKLAKIICENPLSIQLVFEPKGRPTPDNNGDYYRQFKQNCCVICGSEKSYMRLYVVPKEYRIHFPVQMKAHQSHDIVLTCPPCHLKARKHMTILREKLAGICNAPTYISQSSKYKECVKMKNVCQTLLTASDKIPICRKEYLEKSVKDFFGVEYLNPNVLQKICATECVKPENFSHGKKVVEYFNHDLKIFETLWREYFLTTLQPKFLPSAWSIDHNH